MDITEVSILHHVGIVLLLVWLLSCFNCCNLLVYFFSLVYLYLVNEQYVMRLRRKLQFEEKRQAYQRRVLSESETVRWLNHAVEKIWPVCMEQIVSQKILLPIIPWFLQKYKPWTAKEAVVQHLYLGRSPPMFTEVRVLHQPTDDDHLVLELGMNFCTADDMSSLLAVKLRKRLGFGLWAKLHLMGMHVEGKVLVGVKFIRQWPFLGRLRVCFAEPPYFQMIVKPLFTHGVDVTELPGIAGWLDKLLAVAFEQTLVEPNMLVVDVEKFASPQPENWFSVYEKEPISYAVVQVLEAADLKPSDLNGLADPYVKGQFGLHRFRTKTHKKTLAPKWHEEFKIPISTWESPCVLNIEVRDKDHFVDDTLGNCSVNISNLRDGQRHDIWLPLHNVKMGRLHLAITVVEGAGKADEACDRETLNNEDKSSLAGDDTQRESVSFGSLSKPSKMSDKFEPIDIEGQRETGIWIHQPGSEVSQTWEPRKGKSRHIDTQIERESDNLNGSFYSTVSGSYQNDSSSNDESLEGNKGHVSSFRRGLQRFSSVFHKSSRKEDVSTCSIEPVQSPPANIKAGSVKEPGVKYIVDSHCTPSSVNVPMADEIVGPEGSNLIGSFKSTASESYQNDSSSGSSNDESLEGDKGCSVNSVRRGLRKIKSVFRSPQTAGIPNSITEPIQSPAANFKAVNPKEIGVKFILDNSLCTPPSDIVPEAEAMGIPEGSSSIGSLKSTASESHQNGSNSNDESMEGNRGLQMNSAQRGVEMNGSPEDKDISTRLTEPAPSPPANVKEIGVRVIVDDSLCTPCSANVPAAEERDSQGGSDPDSPSKRPVKDMAKSVLKGGSDPDSPNKRPVKDMAKSILKHAGRSAHGIKHALTLRGSRKSQGDSGLVMAGDDVAGYESSDEESLPRPSPAQRSEMFPVVSCPTSSCSDDSLKSKELVQTGGYGPVADALKVSVEGVSSPKLNSASETSERGKA